MSDKCCAPLDSQVWAVGLMTGTAVDGYIDVALLRTDGQSISEFGEYTLAPYEPGTVEQLRQCQQLALEWQFDGAEPSLFEQVEKQLSIEQSNAVSKLLDQAGMSASQISVVGFHGQSVLHRPPQDGIPGMTRQLGDGALMASMLGINVVNDFRRADMLAGGHGAPLSAVYHQALLQQIHSGGDTAVLNLGGVANLSWWDGDKRLIAFDTGPANGPINDFVRQAGGGDFDRDGQLAQQGRVDEQRLVELLSHDYLSKPYPKSLDRFDFTSQMADGCSVVDGAALLTAFSAAAVGCGLELLPKRPERLIICGGGRHNPSLVQALRERAEVDVEPAESVGWQGDAMEAQCFAYLAVRTLNSLPLSFPETTGVPEAAVGGVLHLA